MKHILNVEGIPGAGKSTTAGQLDESFRQSGIDSYWVLEEASDHPVGTLKLCRSRGEKNFASTSLESWESFVKENSRVAILDGYALQSTVRFLFAMNASENTIQDYFCKWQDIGQSCSSIVFLSVEEPEKHFREFVLPLRGKDWCRKVSSYVSSTSYGLAHGFVGVDGLIKFWSEYQAVCLALLGESTIPTLIQNHSDRGWIASHLKSIRHAAQIKSGG